jgi:FKBP-type peptidyl-prolyl cis-trans isomerase
MKEGDRWELVIPSDLAYGERGAPGSPIGPNQTLVFEMELMEVK